MRENIIKIKKNYLFFRNQARDILKMAKRTIIRNKSDKIIVDFARVDFISRSFIDEWLNAVEELKDKGINVKIINLKTELAGLSKKIQETKEKIRQETVAVSGLM